MSRRLRRFFAPAIEAYISLLKTITRVLSFLGKEIKEVVRRPGALFSLILGPFLIMSLFGIGYSGIRRPMTTLVVIPAGANLPRDVGYYRDLTGPAVNIVDVTEKLEDARHRLAVQDVDLLVIAPEDLEGQFRAGQQSTITVEYNSVDPVTDNYVKLIAQQQVQELNRVIIREAAAEGQQYALRTPAAQEASQIPPDVMAAPTRAEVNDLAPSSPSVMQYFAPAVLALVLQHMAITLTALSLIRERLTGAMDIFRVAPVTTMDILVGKYLAYGVLNLAVAGLVAALIVMVLGTPLLGGIPSFAGVVVLLTFASLGLGLFISSVADSERQAVQLSMLILLASVFMSGFVLPLDQFTPFLQGIAYILPVTHGIRLFQDIMLRGGTSALWQIWALAAFGVLLFIATGLSLRRSLRNA